MQSSDFEAFRELMEGVHSFYARECSAFALDVWWQALKHYELAAIRDALGRHSVNPDNGQFMPKPADVVKMMEGSTLDSAMVAWSKVDHAVHAVGTYATVVFDDALIHRVVDDMGGWPPLGRKTDDEWPFTAKEFQTRYRGYRARKETPPYPDRLLGIIDGENQQQGYKLSVPTFVGLPTQARAVFHGGSGAPRIAITVGEHAAALLEHKNEDEVSA